MNNAIIPLRSMVTLSYLYVVLATVLLSLEFALNKKYQALEGVSPVAGLRFNALSGLLSAVIMWIISGFQLEWSAFSLVLALGMALCGMTYSILGFQILKQGGMALYSTFLMSGGMLLPYAFGVIFLNEKLTPLRLLGVAVILAAVILSNFSKQKNGCKQLLQCGAVFVLNGIVSIISKCHQISRDYAAISSSGFVIYSGIGKCIFSTVALLVHNQRHSALAVKNRLSFSVVAGASAIGAASYLLLLIGAKELHASVLYPIITGGSVIFSTVAGEVFFQESIFRRQLISIVLCMIGTLLFL